MSSMSTALTSERQLCAAVIRPAPVSSELLRVLYITHYRHVLQTCRKFFRQPEDAEDAAAEVLRNEAEGQVRQALTSLPEKHRIVLVLHYYDRMHYSQIANALNVSLSAVRVRIFRAKRFLRRKLRRTNRSDTLARLDPEQRPRHNAELTPLRI